MERAKEICPTTTKGKVSNGALIVDVRENNEVSQLAFDVPNIMHIPYSEFESRFTEIPKDTEVVMVCSEGDRSLKTTYLLMNNGYENVFNMSNGLTKWAQKGFPTIGDVSSIDKGAASSCCSPAPEKETSSCCAPAPETKNSSCCSPSTTESSCC
tara:strand:+ start:69521 stop:69985 length:465 start_codon:yes stop_codon:yes gene_type:complete